MISAKDVGQVELIILLLRLNELVHLMQIISNEAKTWKEATCFLKLLFQLLFYRFIFLIKVKLILKYLSKLTFCLYPLLKKTAILRVEKHSTSPTCCVLYD